jgi:hypothetical protein
MVTLTDEEIRFRQQQAVARLIERAHFPVLRRLGEFNFDFQPNLNRTQIMEFKNLAFLDNRENIVLIGNPGVGKTHLAIGIGIEACEQGKWVFFTTFHNLLAQLRTAYDKGYIERIMRRFARYDLLIIDEIGYLPIEHDEANPLFQLINARYEQKFYDCHLHLFLLYKKGPRFSALEVSNTKNFGSFFTFRSRPVCSRLQVHTVALRHKDVDYKTSNDNFWDKQLNFHKYPPFNKIVKARRY